VTGTFSNGQIVVDTVTSANAFVMAANSSYLKLTNVQGVFNTGDNVQTTSGANAEIYISIPVLVLNNISGGQPFQALNSSAALDIVGQASGSVGQCNNQLLIRYPDLVKHSGSVAYYDNISPVTLSRTSQEQIQIVIGF